MPPLGGTPLAAIAYGGDSRSSRVSTTGSNGSACAPCTGLQMSMACGSAALAVRRCCRRRSPGRQKSLPAGSSCLMAPVSDFPASSVRPDLSAAEKSRYRRRRRRHEVRSSACNAVASPASPESGFHLMALQDGRHPCRRAPLFTTACPAWHRRTATPSAPSPAGDEFP